MRSLVLLKVRELSKAFVTVRTRIRLVTGVYAHVLCQVAGVEESLRAMCALVVLVPALVFVNSASVDGQGNLRVEHL